MAVRVAGATADDQAMYLPQRTRLARYNRSYPSRLDFLRITVGPHSAPIFWAKGGVRQSSGLTHCPQLSFRPGDSKLIGCGTLAKALRSSGSPASDPHPPPPSYLA